MNEELIINVFEQKFPGILFFDGGFPLSSISLKAVYHDKVMSIQQSSFHYCDSATVEIAVWDDSTGSDFIRLSDFTDDVCGYVDFNSLVAYAEEFFGA